MISILLQVSFFYYLKVDCTWSEWTEEYCNCKTGRKEKTRVMYPAQFGGKPCQGESKTIEICKDEDCPGKNLYHLLIF